MDRSFYNRDCVQVARELLGKRLVSQTEDGVAAGRIVEVEAYLGADDSASHSYRGLNRRNRTMFGPPGHAYVYSIHSRYCMNVVTQPEGTPHAVLIRALKPLEGVDLMRRRRGRDKELELTPGPARLCEALAIDRKLDGWDLTVGERLWIAADDDLAETLPTVVSPRIGVTSAKESLLRFFWSDCKFVSGRRSFNRRLESP